MKRRLLTIPHLIIIASLAATTWTWRAETTHQGTTYERSAGVSLLGLLVLVAVVARLYTGRYPRPLPPERREAPCTGAETAHKP